VKSKSLVILKAETVKKNRESSSVDMQNSVAERGNFVKLSARLASKGMFGTAPRTLLHKLRRGAAPQKIGVRGVPI